MPGQCSKLKCIKCLCVVAICLPIVVFFAKKSTFPHSSLNMATGNRTFFLTIDQDVGRFGNKIFKYAALLGIAEREGGKPVVLPYTRHQDMESLFDLTYVEHSIAFDVSGWMQIWETHYAYYDPVFENMPKRNLRLRGFLQSWKYFRNVEDVVRREFKITKKYRDLSEGILTEIREKHPNTVFVGVHVRRPDERSTNTTCVCPRSYFMNAFQKMKTLLPGEIPLFIVAGNDLAWCRENLVSNETVVLPSYSIQLHFAILASCRHLIVSVGTYGWWAGWLTGGRVIYYKKFPLPNSREAKGFYPEDYYPPDWIGVDD